MRNKSGLSYGRFSLDFIRYEQFNMSYIKDKNHKPKLHIFNLKIKTKRERYSPEPQSPIMPNRYQL